MTTVDEDRIRTIVQRVVAQMGTGDAAGRPASPASPEPGGRAAPGVFPDVDSAVAAAKVAQKTWGALPLERRGEILTAMRQVVHDNATLLARLAHEETGLGRVEDKVQKNLLVASKTPGIEDLRPLAWTGDRGLTLVESAPYGVIGAITPVTNPTSTIICNAIGILTAGNSVVFNCHPGAKVVSATTVALLNRAIVAAGGPPNTLTCPIEPTIASAQALMRHPGIRLLIVTGGPGVVREAMHSGKKAICAGPGNPPVVVDETADLDQAGRDIVVGAGFDNNVVCVLEKEVFVVDAIADGLKAAMKRHGAVEITSLQLSRLMKVIFQEIKGPREESVINKDWVGKNAGRILKEIGVAAGDEVRLVIAEVDADHPLVWTEQLMPVMPLVRVRSADEAIDLAIAAEGGRGHTAVMHSKHLDHLSRMAREINTTIFIKNGPSLAGLGFGGEGYASFSIASPTGEGLTSAKNFSRVRRCTLVDSFRIV
jgi:acyl-CoA reductase-like NAD-dependent aldehyde dehydrogenase